MFINIQFFTVLDRVWFLLGWN